MVNNCPHCEDELEYLCIYVKETSMYTVSIEPNNLIDWEYERSIDFSEEKFTIECPKCQHEFCVADGYDEATNKIKELLSDEL